MSTMQDARFRDDGGGKHDVELALGGGSLHCDRAILVMWSAYFRKRLASKEFKGQKRVTINLDDKNVDDVEELLYVLYPPNKPLDDDNIGRIMTLARDFEMKEIVRRCEKFLLAQPATAQLLLHAQTFSMPSLKKKCIESLKTKPYSTLSSREGFLEELSPANSVLLLYERIRHLEGRFTAADKRHESNKVKVSECITIFDELNEAVGGPPAGSGGRKLATPRDKARRKRAAAPEAIRGNVLELCDEALCLIHDGAPRTDKAENASQTGWQL